MLEEQLIPHIKIDLSFLEDNRKESSESGLVKLLDFQDK
jgi:hypothetical protein